MLEIAYATGMRVTEIISLDIDDIDFENSCVMCKNANKQRVIPLGKLALKALKEYIEEARPVLIAEWCRFEINTNNVRAFRYFINTSIYAIPR